MGKIGVEVQLFNRRDAFSEVSHAAGRVTGGLNKNLMCPDCSFLCNLDTSRLVTDGCWNLNGSRTTRFGRGCMTFVPRSLWHVPQRPPRCGLATSQRTGTIGGILENDAASQQTNGLLSEGTRPPAKTW